MNGHRIPAFDSITNYLIYPRNKRIEMPRSTDEPSDSGRTGPSRRDVLLGATAAAAAGTGVLGYAATARRAEAGCDGDLGSSIGSQCSQDNWSREGFDRWEDCGDYDTYEHYNAYQNNFNVSWTKTSGSNYYFETASGAQSYWTEHYYTDEMCNGNGEPYMLQGGSRIDSFTLDVEMRDGTYASDTQLVAHTDYTKGGGMDHDRWETWVENEGGNDYTACEVENEFENEGYDDPNVALWESAVNLGLSTAVGYVSTGGGIAIGLLPIIGQIANQYEVSRTVETDTQDRFTVTWDAPNKAQLTHGGKFNVDMASYQDDDVILDITQTYTLNNSVSVNDSMEWTIVIPSNDCDPYVYSSSMF